MEKHYAFVGVMEEEETSLRLFELLVPKFFRNATTIYWLDKGTDKHVIANSNSLSKKVTNATRAHLLTSPVFDLEYDFYNFILQRFNMQKKFYLENKDP